MRRKKCDGLSRLPIRLLHASMQPTGSKRVAGRARAPGAMSVRFERDMSTEYDARVLRIKGNELLRTVARAVPDKKAWLPRVIGEVKADE